VKRHLYQVKTFGTGSFPDYECPKCGAHLKLGDIGLFDSMYTKGSRKYNDEHDQDHENGVFHVCLTCTRPSCEESIVVVGTTYMDELHDDDYLHNRERHFITYCTPEYFIPPLEMFKIPDATPHKVKECIKASFNLFFVSSGSALNEIRNAVEFLMDELQVPRKGLDDNGMEERWDLDKRVGKMPNVPGTTNVKSQLLQVKNLGNWGSHAVETDRTDVLNAYELLHYVLDELYLKRGELVKNLTQRVKEDERAK